MQVPVSVFSSFGRIFAVKNLPATVSRKPPDFCSLSTPNFLQCQSLPSPCDLDGVYMSMFI